MAKLAVIFGLLALASFSSADIMFVCAPNITTCPNQPATYANCNFTSTIEWEVTFGGDTIGSVEMNISDPFSVENVTVNGIDMQFLSYGGVSTVYALSPNASLNGVLLSCTDTENTTDLMTETCPNPIAGIFDSSNLPAPQNLTLDYDSINDTSIEYSWDPPATSHVCRDAGDMYLVRISVNGATTFRKGSLTMDKLIEQGAGVNQEHCISVTTQGTDKKSGMYTPEVCITIDRPAPVDIAEPVYTLPPMGRMTSVRMNWSYEPDSRPMIWRYYVRHNFTRPTPEESSGSGSGDMDEPTGNTNNPFVTIVVNPDTTSLMFPGVLEGWWYSFSVIAENVLGNTTSSTVFVVQRPPMTTPTATPTMAASTFPTPSVTTTVEGTDATTLPVWAIAVIAVGGAIVLAMIVAFVVIIFCCCFCGVTAGKAKKREEHEMHGTKL